MIVGLQALLTGPLPVTAAALGLGLGALWAWEAARGGPAARTQARLEAVLARGRTATERDETAPLLLTRRRGALGRLRGWSETLAQSIGGRGALLRLWAIGAAAGIGGLVAGLGPFGLPFAAAGAVGAAAGLAAFAIARGEMRRRWSVAFLDQLVEAVELLTRSVRSGYSTPAAIRMVGREAPAPVGPVFARIADEDDLGIELRQSLRAAAERIKAPDFSFLAVALIIQRETGGQLGDSLDSLHFVLRKRKEARLKIAALTAEGRMSAIVVGALPFVAGAGMWLLDPARAGLLLSDPTGRVMLGAAGGLLLFGLVVIRQMTAAKP
jgi:Flp pilus assembly protein TadB